MEYANLEKTAGTGSKVTNAKNKFYRFLAAMLAYAANGIPLKKSQALDPKKLAEFLADWKRVSPDANLNHIQTIEGPVLEQFNTFKDEFINAQVDFKLKSLNASKPFLSDKEKEQLIEATTTYEKYIRSEVDRMAKRVKLATPVKTKVKAK